MRGLTVLTRWALRLALAGWALALLALVLLHAWVLPHLQDWKPRLEAWGSAALGAPLRIGSIEALPNGLLPAVRVRGLQVLDAGEATLEVPEAILALSPRSLWRGSMEQLALRHPHLQVRQTPTGLRVAGQDVAWPEAGQPPSGDLPPMLLWLLRQPELLIEGGRLSWQPAAVADHAGFGDAAVDDADGVTMAAPGPAWHIDGIELLMRYQPLSLRHEWSVRLQPSWTGAAALELRAQLRRPLLAVGDAAGWPRWSGQVYIRWPQFDVAALAPVVAALPPLQGIDWQQLKPEGRLGVQTWLELDDGQLRRLTADVVGRDVQARLPGASMSLALDELQSRLRASHAPSAEGSDWEVQSEGLRFSAQGLSWQDGDVHWQYHQPSQPRQSALMSDGARRGASRWPQALPARMRLAVSTIDVAALSRVLGALAWEPQDAQAAPPARPDFVEANADQAWSMALLGRMLQRWQPSGTLRDLALEWQGRAGEVAPHWRVQAHVEALRLGMDAPAEGPALPLGLAGWSGALQADAHGGAFIARVRDGLLRLPTVFEEPELPLQTLDAELRWRLGPHGQLDVEAPSVRFANADAKGELQAHWRTLNDDELAAPVADVPASRYPGVLQLNGTLSDADGARAARYLPLTVAADVRRYVREAVQKGRIRQADVDVHGDLRHFPFDPVHEERAGASGELFRIVAELEDVDYRYAPHYLLHESTGTAGSPALVWPDLQAVGATLRFEGNRMALAVREGHLRDAPALRIASGSSARIDDLGHAVLQVDATLDGPLQPQLERLARSPVARMTDHLMDALTATGDARLRLQLGLPLDSRHGGDYRVQGELQLKGNDLQWWPEVPVLQGASGLVRFTDKGFDSQDLRGRALGGELRLTAAMDERTRGQPTHTRVQAQGRLSAAGLQTYLQRATGGGPVLTMARALEGESDYRLDLQLLGQRPYLSFSSDMVGMASHLPSPLQKPADTARPLVLQHQPAEAGATELWQLDWGELVAARYRLTVPTDAAAPRQVQQGQVFVGDFSADERRHPEFIAAPFVELPQPPRVQVYVDLPELDAQAWYRLLAAPAVPASPAATATAAAAATGTTTMGTPPASTASATAAAPQELVWKGLIPDVWNWRVGRLQWGPRNVHGLRMQLYQAPDGQPIWHANVQAQEMLGALEYHPDYLERTGLVRGRLQYLELPEAITESLGAADAASPDAAAPAAGSGLQRLPTLDLEIDRLLFASRDWGKVALQAMNRVEAGVPSQWRINHLSIDTPEARLSASGNWEDLQPDSRPHTLLEGRKRMAMDFSLELRDAGRLLARLGMPGLLRGGKGSLEGRLGWLGSPVELDLPSLNGRFHINVGQGQFLRADAGMARLLGVLSLQALPRRLTLDFRDVFSEGFAFDAVQGDVQMAAGKAHTSNLQMQGVNAAVALEGSADLVRETQDIRVVVVPEVNTLAASLVATAINPAIGAGTLLAQLLLDKPLADATTRAFHIHGSWQEPVVDRVGAAAAAPAAPAADGGDPAP
ncbi:TIGR02099 family protein [Corticibacter populi]|uniref:TIGR02099 family protein n=1 Tax=Corticibacter populi TaxID=1550736 RepID=A0A3M6QRI4_9BURK|nr:TIGR02099 family protein [Corticibacter populi]